MIQPQTYKGSNSMLNGEEVHLYVIIPSLPTLLLFVSWCNFSWTWHIAQVKSWPTGDEHTWQMGANMVKYITPLPYTCLSESVSKLYTNFEFCEGKNHKHLKNTLIYKAKQFMLTKLF